MELAARRMELVARRRLELFSGRSHPDLAYEIAGHLGVELGEPNLREFADEATPIHLCGPQGVQRTVTLGELLPFPFSLGSPAAS